MPIVVICSCKTRVKVPDELTGKRVRCPKCRQSLGVPAREDEVEELKSCPSCEVLLPTDAVVCVGCGLDLRTGKAAAAITNVKVLTAAGIPAVDELLADAQLLPVPRAVLLLRVCQWARGSRPDLIQIYLPMLLEIGKELPGKLATEFTGLRQALDAPAVTAGSPELGQFAAAIIDQVNQASGLAATDPGAALQVFRQCEEKLRTSWLRPGKEPAWIALVNAWADVNRSEGLPHIHRLPVGEQQYLLERQHKREPLTAAEWEMAQTALGTLDLLVEVAIELLIEDEADVALPATLAEKVADRFLALITVPPPIHDKVNQIEEQDHAFAGFSRLIACLSPRTPEVAESLLERGFAALSESEHFARQWPDRFTWLRRLLNLWVQFVELRPLALRYLARSAPAHLRDFCLAHWYAMTPSNLVEILDSWEALQAACKDRKNSEAWFLVMLVRRGREPEALALARASTQSDKLLPRIYRAWLQEHPETAPAGVKLGDFKDDLLGRFLFLKTTEERLGFLRSHSRNGQTSLPAELWSRPNSGESNASARTLYGWYTINEAPARQFGEYARLHGYRNFRHEALDRILLTTLIAWDEQDSSAVEELLGHMWSAIEVRELDLHGGLVRDVLLQRCQMVFAARPFSFIKSFVCGLLPEAHATRRASAGWRGPVLMPFSLCLHGAIGVGEFCSKRRDAMLTYALREFKCDTSRAALAARVYAADKGLKAIHSPTSIAEKPLREAWQRSVVEASLSRVLDEFAQR